MSDYKKRNAPPAWLPATPQKLAAHYKALRTINEAVTQVLTKAEQPHPLVAKLSQTVGWEADEFHHFVRRHQQQFEARLYPVSVSNSSPAIPAITHRIWVTSEASVVLPNEDFFVAYLKSVEQLPSEITHYFWVNNSSVANHVRQACDARGICNVITIDIGLFAADPLYQRVIQLIAERKYVLAGDFVRILALQRFGGIYSDLGVVFDKHIYDLTRMADYSLLVWDGGFFQTSFLACRPHSDLIEMYLAVLNHPEVLRSGIPAPGLKPTADNEVEICAGPGFTAIAMLFMPLASNVLMLPPQSAHLRWRSQQSWYGKAKNGNVLVTQSSPSFLNEESIKAADELTQSVIKPFGRVEKVYEQLRILVGTRSYFERNPTRLCRILFHHHSDKALAWHNYSYIYNYIFLSNFLGVDSILEVRNGTNDPDAPSSMASCGVPGASLRAWREFFPEATVIGADIDRNIPFQAERIETYYVDQDSPDTIKALFAELGTRKPNIIIDDGLHVFHANRTLLQGAFDHLAAGGIYLIEDLPKGTEPSWETYLKSSVYDAVLVAIPNERNASDNRVVFITGKRPVKT